MNVKRAVRLLASTIVVMALALSGACGDDDGTGTNENGLVGSWRATSLVVDGVEMLAGTSLSMTMTIRADDTYTISASGDTDGVFCEGTTSCTESGTYIHTSTTFTLCDPGCDEAGDYTISGDTLTYHIVEDDGTEVTVTFVRV